MNADDNTPHTPDEPAEDALGGAFAQFFELLSTLEDSSGQAAEWAGRAWTILRALQKLARTLARLLYRLKGLIGQRDPALKDPAQPLISDEDWRTLQAQLDELLASFPDAGELFFGFSALDEMSEELFAGEGSAASLRQLERFAQHIDLRVRALMTRLFGRIFDAKHAKNAAEGFDLAQIEPFLRALESLLQEILDRWVIARAFDISDDADPADRP